MTELLHEGASYRIATTHFTWSPGGQIIPGQLADFARLKPVLSTYPDYVLCGDFNAPRGREMFARFTDELGLVDHLPAGITTTIDGSLHYAGALELVVDTIFSTSGYRVSDLEVLEGVSDHKGLLATIERGWPGRSAGGDGAGPVGVRSRRPRGPDGRIRVNRNDLDALVAEHHLSASDVALAMSLAHARPAPSELRYFLVRSLRLAGFLSIAAGVIFFVAANWDALRVAGRFALLEGLFVVCIGVAFWRPPPRASGRYALLGAFIVLGSLLALFGQTYQTGANTYELFLSWALLGLLLVVAGQWSVLCAAWLLVFDVALALFCGSRPEGGLFWGIIWALPRGAAWSTSLLLLVASSLNLVLWAMSEWVHVRRPESALDRVLPDGLRRFVVACALAFATWAGCLAVQGSGEIGAIVWLVLLLAGAGFFAFWRRADVFPLALIAASIIIVGMAAIMEHVHPSDVILSLVIAGWLVVTSTLSGRVLMALLRSWNGRAVHA